MMLNKYKLFPYLEDKILLSKLKIDDDSVYYISIRDHATKITNIIIYHLSLININPQNAIITDGTAGVGGNTLSFCSKFKKVYAIEIDELRASYLKNNINVYGYTNVVIMNDNCLNVFDEISDSNVIFIDPPWGGRNYKKYNKLKLTLSTKSIENICLDVLNNKNIKLVVLKLPFNYDLLYFYWMLKDYIIYLYDLNKMLILVVHNRLK